MMHNIFCRRPYKLHLYRSFLMPELFQKSKGPLMVSKNVFCRSKAANAFDNNVVVQIFPFSSSAGNFSRYPKRFISLYLLPKLQRVEKCANSLRSSEMRLAEICKFTTNAIYHQVEKQLQFNGNGVGFRLISSFFDERE